MDNRTLFAFLSVFFLPFFLISQDIKIVYNAENGSMEYFRDGVPISRPAVKKGALILLEIKNYNNYLYDIDFQETHETFQVAPGSGLLGGIQTLGFAEILPNFDLSDSDADGVVDIMDIEPSIRVDAVELSAEERKIQKLEAEISSTVSNLNSLERQTNQRALAVQKLKDQRALRAISLEEVKKIKYHPRIPPTRIKTYSESYFEKVLDVSDINDVSLSYLLEKKSDKEELREMLAETQEDEEYYSDNVQTLEHLAEQLKTLRTSSSHYVHALQVLEHTPKVTEKIHSLDQSIQALLGEAQNDNIQDLIEIYYEYEEISANTFSKSFRAQGAGDMVNLDVSMLLKDSLRGTDAPQVIRLSTIKVPVYGGIKLNASVGLNFGSFFQQPQNYFVRDSIIRSQGTDRFLPYATSFIHFYSQGRKSVSVGGSLGIGIPVSGGGPLSSPTFFIGPSLFFGNSERIVLNFGLMGGKVPQLSQGYEVGDVFEADASFVPIESLYEIGAFMGLSFNIRG